MWAIYRKEMRTYLQSKMAWVFWIGFSLLFGFAFNTLYGNFVDQQFQNPDASVTEIVTRTFGFWKFLLLFMIPALTARLFAEERQTGTLELLFTYPLTEGQLIFGKFLAAATIQLVLLVLTLPQFLYLGSHSSLEWTVVGTTYLGLMLFLSTMLAGGLFFSSRAESNVVAFFTTTVVYLVLWLGSAFQPQFAQFASLDYQVAWYLRPVFFVMWLLTSALRELSFGEYYDSFSKGLISTKDVMFYVTATGYLLYLTYKQIESRKWKG